MLRKGYGSPQMYSPTTLSTVTPGTSPVTIASFKPAANGGVWWKYAVDFGPALTGRIGEIFCRFDISDNVTSDFEATTVDTADYLTAPGKPTAVLSATGSTNTDGDHYVKITYTTAAGETTGGTASDLVTVAGSNDINLTDIPISTDAACTGRKVYMTAAGGSDYFLVDSIANNTTTSYSIVCADGSLGAAMPTSNTSALADSSDLVFTTSMSAGVVSLKATSTTYTWTVKTVEDGRI